MRAILASLLVLFLTAGAFAGEISEAGAQLAIDVAARVTAIGSPRPKELAKEGKYLSSAQAKLDKYSGKEDVAGLKTLAGAGKFIALSRTADPAILADVTRLLQAFLAAARGRDGRFDSIKSEIVDPKHLALLKSLQSVADKALADAERLLPTNPVKAAALLVSAYDKFGLLTALAGKYVNQEDGGPPPDGMTIVSTPTAVQLVNSGSETFTISRIRVFASYTDGGTLVKAYVGQSAAGLIPGLFAVKGSNRIAAAGGVPTTYDLLANILAPLVPDGTATPGASGELHVYLSGEKFFVVPFDVTLP